MKYYIWVNGEEHGPYDFDQLYETWQDGSAPQGFLWRREDQKTFSMPDALADEFNRVHPKAPSPKDSKTDSEQVESPKKDQGYIDELRKKSNYPITRWILKACSWIAYALILIAIVTAAVLLWRKDPDPYTRIAFMVSATMALLSGIIFRLLHEFGSMMADHTDVQIDIGRNLGRRTEE